MSHSTSRRTRGFAALGVTAALVVSACGGGGGTSNQGSGNQSGSAGFDAASKSIVNPSDAKGGTLKFANAGDWDTLDPGETYYAYSWNFARLYGRSLMMFKSARRQGGQSAGARPRREPLARRAMVGRRGPTSCARASSSMTAPRSLRPM